MDHGAGTQSNVEAGLEMTTELLESLGAKRKNIEALTKALRAQFNMRSSSLAALMSTTGSHDSVASSENDVFKLDEESLPQVRPSPSFSYCLLP